MSIPTADPAARTLWMRVEAVACLWLVLLPMLRPLIWSGQPTDIPNLFFLVLLAAAITTGSLLRGLESPTPEIVAPWWQRPSHWGMIFLGMAAIGSVLSPLPATAWTLTAGWALHLAAPWALFPAIRRHPHLVVAGLVAGFAGEAFLLIGQVCWERPHLAAQLVSDPTLTVEQRIAEQYAVRIGSWRLEGTFLLANTLATYLLLILPIVAAIAWRQRSAGMRWRIASGLLVAMVVAALVMTGSKAGILAGIIAVVAMAALRCRSWRWRGGIIAAPVVMLAVALFVPGLRQALAGSAGVRLDYWRAGIALVQERPLTGHGLEGFAVHYPRVKPPAGEETILAHQETLQTAVDLGIPAMIILIGWWVIALWSLRSSGAIALASGMMEDHRPGWTVWIGLSLVLLFGLFQAGILRANFTAYPWEIPWLWAAVFMAALLAIVWIMVRLPLPPRTACGCAVLACLIHVQADFSLHSMQVVGVLAWVAMLGLALDRPIPPAPATFAGTARQGRFAIAGLLVLAATAAGIMASSARGETLERARGVEAILARLRLAESGRLSEEQRGATFEAFEHVYARMVVEEREAALASDPREGLAKATIRQAITASRRFPADHDLVFVAVGVGEHFQALLPQRAEVLTPILEDLLSAWPQDLLVTKALSEHYLRLARRATGERRHIFARQAQALGRRAVELYPTHLPLRQTLIQAAEITGDQATISEQQAEIARLGPLVHRDNRLR